MAQSIPYPDPLAILDSTIGQTGRIISDYGNQRIAIARDRADKEYRNSIIESQRRYEVDREERFRRQRKDDASEERLRMMRNTLSSLGGDPSGIKDEAELSRLIEERTRQRSIRYSDEDAKRAMDHEIKKAQGLTEERLRTESELLGVPGARDPKVPLSNLQAGLAEAKVRQEQKIAEATFNAQMESARSNPNYAPLKAEYANLAAQRGALIGIAVQPEPSFNPQMTPEEQAVILRKISEMPEVKKALGNDKLKLAQVAMGDSSPIAALGSRDAENIGRVIASKADMLETEIRNVKGLQWSKAMDTYMSRLRSLPDIIRQLDNRMTAMESIGSKEGINFGLALKMENPDELKKGWMAEKQAQAVQSVPGVQGNKQGGQNGLPPLPPQGSQPSQSAQPGDTQGRTKVTGAIPWIADQVSGALSGDALQPVNKVVSTINSGLSGVGDGYRTVSSGLFGGEVPTEFSGPPPQMTPMELPGGLDFFREVVGRPMSAAATIASGEARGMYSEPWLKSSFELDRRLAELNAARTNRIMSAR